jgi:hypothetical protein
MTKSGTVASGAVRLKCKLLGDSKRVYSELRASAEQHTDTTNMQDVKDSSGADEQTAIEHVGKIPNELHVQLVKAKGLPAVDKAILMGASSSDPFVTLNVCGNSAKSTVKKRNLNPEWNETFVLPVDDPTAVLLLEVYDHDMVGASDFMCRCKIPLQNYIDMIRNTGWHNLAGESLEEAGSIEVSIWWKFNPERASRLLMDLNDDADDEINDTIAIMEYEATSAERQAVARAAAKASAKEMAAATATDLRYSQYMEEIAALSETQDSTNGSANTEPPTFKQWEEAFALKELDACLKGVDVRNKSASDFVEAFRARKPDATVMQLVGLVKRELRLEEEADISEFMVDLEEDEVSNAARCRTPNEVCIALVRGRGLKAVDTSLIGSPSSDPVVTFEVEGHTSISSCVAKNLNPVWKELFRLPIPLRGQDEGPIFLHALVEDVDLHGKDFIGKTKPIDLSKFTKKWGIPAWYNTKTV